MKQYTDSTNRYIDYIRHQQNVVANISTNKWFEEFYLPQERDKILDANKAGVDCGTKSVTKQMLDDLAQLDRARNIRNKSRTDFFVSARTRGDGAAFNLYKKTIVLSDGIV